MAQEPLVVHYRGFTITLGYTNHSRYNSSGLVISPTQRPLPNNKQHSEGIDIHAIGEDSNPQPHKWAAAEPRLRPRGHWDQQVVN
jgi:hypothetical protein